MAFLQRIRAVFDAIEELVQLWSFSTDLESFEYSCKELMDFFVGQVSYYDRIMLSLAHYGRLWHDSPRTPIQICKTR